MHVTQLVSDDLVMIFEAKTFEELNETLTEDLQIISEYYKAWRLTPNPNKSEVSVFHLNNRAANRTLNVTFDAVALCHNPNPVYLGLKLDRTLSFKKHLDGLSKKLASRVNIIQRITGTNWGASAKSLRTSSFALVYAPAEYVAPAWKNSAYVHKVDTQLNQAMRIVSGSLKSTSVKWLPVLSNIVPLKIRRDVAANRIFCKFKDNEQSLLCNELKNPPRVRLKSRRPIFHEMTEAPLDAEQLWRDSWNADPPPNAQLIDDPSVQVPGFELPRRHWTTVNRLRTGHGRCNYLMNKWQFKDSAACSCGAPKQTTGHIVNECIERRYEGGLVGIHSCDPLAVDWIKKLDVNL